jgi:hypothetical protein
VKLPGKLVPATAPVDTAKRINVVGREAIGESCQWWFSAGIGGLGFDFPIPMAGNQNHLAIKDALDGEYDGLIGAATDHRTTQYGLAVPTGSDPNPSSWARLFLTSVCVEIRGTPFTYTQPLAGATK